LNFHRRTHSFGDLNRFQNEIRCDPSPESPAKQRDIDLNRFLWKAGLLLDGRMRPVRILSRRPDFTMILCYVGRAVDRLEGRVRLKWNVVDCFDRLKWRDGR